MFRNLALQIPLLMFRDKARYVPGNKTVLMRVSKVAGETTKKAGVIIIKASKAGGEKKSFFFSPHLLFIFNPRLTPACIIVGI